MTMYNVEFPARLKQGQVEMQPEGLSYDFKGGALIHKSQVQDINSVIKSKGDKKIAILTAIKDFKKGIYRLQWENQGCDMKVNFQSLMLVSSDSTYFMLMNVLFLPQIKFPYHCCRSV